MGEILSFLEEMRAEIKKRRPLRRLVSLYHKVQGRRNFREVVRNGIRWKLRYIEPEKEGY